MTVASTTYTVCAVRDGDWWAIDVPGVDGVYTQARRLDQVEGVAREAISLMLDVAPETFEVVVDARPSPPVDDPWQRVMALRQQAAEIDRQAQRATLELVHRCQDEGLSLRDIGHLLGLSQQRVGQIARAPRADGADSRPTAPSAQQEG